MKTLVQFEGLVISFIRIRLDHRLPNNFHQILLDTLLNPDWSIDVGDVTFCPAQLHTLQW